MHDFPPRIQASRARLAKRIARSRARKIWNGFFAPRVKPSEIALREDLRSTIAIPKKSQHQVDDLVLRFAETMVQALDARDPYTAGHSHRVSAMSTAIAER